MVVSALCCRCLELMNTIAVVRTKGASAVDAYAVACVRTTILNRFILSSLIKPLLRKAVRVYVYRLQSKGARENEIFYVY